MKKLAFIFFLTLPLFLFSQEQQIYHKTMSLSQFVQELKQAAKEGNGYTLENCHITYSNSDKKYLSNKNSSAIIDESLDFNENSLVSIKNCKFGERISHESINTRGWNNKFGISSSTLTFKGSHFGDLILNNIDVDIKLDGITADIGVSYKISNKILHTLEIIESDINGVYLNCYEENQKSDVDYEVKIEKSNINFCIARNLKSFRFLNNQVSTLITDGYCKDIKVVENDFFSSFCNLLFLRFSDSETLQMGNYSGIEIGKYHKNTEINNLIIKGNKFQDISSNLSNDTLLDILKGYEVNKGKYQLMWLNRKDKLTLIHNERELQLDKNLYNDKWPDEEKLNFLCNFLKDKDSLDIKYESVARISIRGASLDNFKISNNKINECFIFNNKITTSLEITKTTADSLMYFYKNIIPDKHNISIDKSPIHNLGFLYSGGYYYGNENYVIVKDKLQEEKFQESFLDLSAQYRQFISIYHENGSDFKTDAVIALKDFQTNKKMYKYYQDPDIINLLNWWGGEFLAVYCDYGLNPFKALKYCFYVMLIFGLFYFFFYSDWDKIDRAFLIQRFSNVIDYFSSEKRIQDFYTDNHNQEMKTFVDFKSLLEKNKVHTPFFLHVLAKPLYKLSLVRYRALNYWYRKAEFMAGKRWGDLELKERYVIGSITMILLFFYIVYLMFIRGLNSVILSLNAFSTLGFGQIPVKGFTKYIAIIEGFIGWFLLGVFIVSLLNQMSNI